MLVGAQTLCLPDHGDPSDMPWVHSSVGHVTGAVGLDQSAAFRTKSCWRGGILPPLDWFGTELFPSTFPVLL